MTKTRKKDVRKASKAPKKRASTVEGTRATTIAAIERGVLYLTERLDAIIGGDAGESKFDPESRAAHLLKQLTAVAESMRRAEAAQSRRLEKITRSQVLMWFRTQLDPNDRAAMVREVQRIDAEESVLA